MASYYLNYSTSCLFFLQHYIFWWFIYIYIHSFSLFIVTVIEYPIK